MADGEQIYNERKSEELVYSRSADYSTRSLHAATTLDRYLYLSIQLIRQDQKGKERERDEVKKKRTTRLIFYLTRPWRCATDLIIK